MEQIKLKHTIRFYVSVIFSLLLCFALSILIVFGILIVVGIENQYWFIIGLILSLFVIIYLIITLLKAAPIVAIDAEKIYFGRKKAYYLSDISNIKLTGKVKNIESALIKFKDGTTKSFPDDSYSNAWQIKQMLYKSFLLKESKDLNQNNIIDVNAGTQCEIIFKDNPYKSFIGISMWGLPVFLLATLILVKISILHMSFILFFSVCWFVLFALQMQYVCLTKDYLEIKNHMFFQMKDLYRLCDIKEIVYEAQYRMPITIRIITNDFKSRYYFIPTLNESTLLRLKLELKAKGIAVRNECI